jgi:hypothetical protein
LLLASNFYHEVLNVTMNITPRNTNAQPNLPRFGGLAVHGGDLQEGMRLSASTQQVEKAMDWLAKSRGQQMIVEDFVGFGGLRSGLDLMRGFFYGTGGLNFPAASERLLREGASILTDNILSGFAAQGMGKLFDLNGKSFSNGFTDYPTLEAFQKVVAQGKPADKDAFIQQFSEHLQPYLPNETKGAQFKAELRKIWDKLPSQASNATEIKNWSKVEKPMQAGKLAMALGQQHFDLVGQKGMHTFRLDNLLDDLRIFKTHMQTRAVAESGVNWANLAENSIANTLKAKYWKLSCIALGMGATFAVPFVNMVITRYRYGINYYPGEIGLRKNVPAFGVAGQGLVPKTVPSPPVTLKERMERFGQKHMPYLTKQLKEGNPLPLALALLPLPVAIGMFDVSARKFVLNIFAKNKLRNMFDFTKGWPFTAPQQMASMFALLITSRLMCARSDNEYRELVLDSFMGWGAWILGTPLLKKAAANLLDQGRFPLVGKTMLLNGKTIRSADEIKLLDEILKNSIEKGESLVMNGVKGAPEIQKMLQRTLTANVWMGAVTTGITIGVLGILTPLIGIKLTQHFEKRKQKREDAPIVPAMGQVQRPAVSTASPFGPMSQSNGFRSASSGFNPVALSGSRPGFPVGVAPFGFPPLSGVLPAPDFSQRPA